MKITDNERQLLQYIAMRCSEATDCIEKNDKELNAILGLCNELTDRINYYLEVNY